MHTAAKLGAFALVAAGVFASAYGVGRVVGPVDTATSAAPASEHSGDGHAAEAPPAQPGGLLVADQGLTFKVLTADLAAGAPGDFAFQILGPDGKPVTAYRPTHDKLMHLIVARRDLSGFRHVHPELGPDGTWRVPLSFAEAGEYRAFADFLPETTGQAITLGADVSVAGDYRPKPLPEASATANVDGYAVTLNGGLTAGKTSKLMLTVSRNGVPVTDLQPYLGAYGHLVALRQGDLAYLHVHPEGAPGDGKTAPGPRIVFYAEVPSAGDYRLYLDFQHNGVVRTAEFTVHAVPPVRTAAPPPPAAPADGHGHSH
ncbi:hypothetical protein [Amycolatopsis anabasis]|uniref:hypothetical protein n=1 Tax=Amycolatopsis anabasis TaxID=1840409 RepID=UPI00131D69EC|nr:hypothetical protein [Amycolatopsis anabasis]